MSSEPTPRVDSPDEVAALKERVRDLETRLAERRKYGLVWEEPRGGIDDPYESERIADKAERELPVVAEEPEMNIGEGERPHVLIEGDNYFSLLALSYTHHEKIDVIYIDPPYNTGREDFIYNDRFVGEDDAYRHSKWLSFMAPRLNMAKELLHEHAVIIVSIDDNEMAHLRLLMDEVFDSSNFIGNIVRATNSTKSNSNFLSINYDYTLIYAKNKAKLEERVKGRDAKWKVSKNNVDEYEAQVKRLQKLGLSGEAITAELKELTKYPRFVDFVNYWYLDERGLYRKGDLGGVKKGNTDALHNPLTGVDDPVPPGGFRFSADELVRLVDEDRIHFHTDGSLPTIKRYLADNPKQRPKGIMSDDQRPDSNLLANMGIEFDNPKQLAFMKRVLSIFDSDAVVLDFFAGSGTTGHAVLELNAEDDGSRQVILCTDNENGICRDVAHRRLQCVIDGYSYTKEKGRGQKRKAVTTTVPGIGGAFRFFVSDKQFVEYSDTTADMKRAFRTASTDFLRLRENCFDAVVRQRDFALFGGVSASGEEHLLAVLYHLRGGEGLIAAANEQSATAPVVLYGFSLDGQLSQAPFLAALGGRVRFGEVPQQLIDTYERLFRKRLFGGWSS